MSVSPRRQTPPSPRVDPPAARLGGPGELERAREAGEDILRFCVREGGSITGEHGVGLEKKELIGEQFSDDSLEMIRRFKALFDPACLLNPGKVLPTGKGCMEIRQPATMTV